MDTSLECEWRLQERKDQPPQTAVNLSYYKRPVSCVDWTPLTISFQVHTKGNFAEPHFEGEWFSFGIHIQGPIFDMSDTVSWSTLLRVDHVHGHPVVMNSPQEADSGDPNGD